MADNVFPTTPSEYQLEHQNSEEQLQVHIQPQLDQLQVEQSLLPDPSVDSSFAALTPAPAPAPTLADKPYHAKRPHKKSRTGCRNCKARKVKCDEARPTCRSCKLRKVECIYPAAPASPFPSSSAPNTASSVSPVASTTSSTLVRGSSSDGFSSPSPAPLSRHQSPAPNYGSPPLAQPLWQPNNIDASDMKLLWFYTTSTSSSFSVSAPGIGSPIEDILKVRMVQVAFETPFLMDSLFALSSLHMQSLNQDCDPSRALAYRARSFEGYRRAVEAAAPDTYAALIANSLFLTALSSQVFREKDSKELYILDWMIVWRGIGLVIDLMGVERLFDTGMYALFQRPPIDLEAATESIPNHLLFMVSSIKSDDPDHEHIAIYHETLKYLGSLYMNLREGFNPVMNLRIITWFTFLPRHFIDLCRQRRPRALVIVAYYAVFLKLINAIWWLESIGQRSLTDLCHYLGSAWKHLLLVPRAAMEVGDELDVARVIFQDSNWVPPEPTSLHLDPASAITVVDDAGKRLAWTPHERKIMILDSSPPDSIKWGG